MQIRSNKIWVRRGALVFIVAIAGTIILITEKAPAIPLSASIVTPLATAPFVVTPRPWVIPTLAPLPPELASDPALRNPLFASLARQYGADWENFLGSDGHLWLNWQRKIGTHALITSATGADSAADAKVSQFIVGVWEWDHTDLFALGLPRTIAGKPVQIVELGFADFGIVPFRSGK
ncbi:MAG: hypothetical protein HZB53_22010 [Chloroflexi bacterium]|nr:hypothetical protein [Chloroflexota bacterium]